jgi:hypothetical protein
MAIACEKRKITRFNLSLLLEAISKMQITFKDKARADPPSLKKLWRDGRKSGAPPAAG